MCFSCWLLKVNTYAPPLLTAVEEFQKRIMEACAKTDHYILQQARQEVEYGFHTARAICGTDIELF
jgi:hypothetical protein